MPRLSHGGQLIRKVSLGIAFLASVAAPGSSAHGQRNTAANVRATQGPNTGALRIAARAIEAGRLRAAERTLRRLIHRGDEDALVLYGTLLREPGARTSWAARYLDVATPLLEGAPRPPIVHGAVAAYRLQNEPRAALALLERHARPQDALAVSTLRQLAYAFAGQRPADLRTTERTLALAHRLLPQDPDVTLELCAVWIRRGRVPEAVQKLRAFLGLRRGEPRATRMLAASLHSLGHTEEAIPLLLSLDTVPDRIDAARCALEAGTAQRALTLLRDLRTREASENPEQLAQQADAHSVAGMALVLLARPEEALTAFETALSFDPDHAEARRSLQGLNAPPN